MVIRGLIPWKQKGCSCPDPPRAREESVSLPKASLVILKPDSSAESYDKLILAPHPSLSPLNSVYWWMAWESVTFEIFFLQKTVKEKPKLFHNSTIQKTVILKIVRLLVVKEHQECSHVFTREEQRLSSDHRVSSPDLCYAHLHSGSCNKKWVMFSTFQIIQYIYVSINPILLHDYKA